MARRPNYSFERRERERAKAAKKAARALIRAEKVELRKAEKSGEAGIEAGGGAGPEAGEAQPPEPAAEAEPEGDGTTVGS